ncbi:Uncharacterised protein [Vibrio cholerae]|nr:Uncharacterised protein [Vibrio cholerae]
MSKRSLTVLLLWAMRRKPYTRLQDKVLTLVFVMWRL